jgi:hypothetical protein
VDANGKARLPTIEEQIDAFKYIRNHLVPVPDEWYEESYNEDGTVEKIDFRPMTLAALMQSDVAVEYLIHNLLAAREPTLLAGPVKSLKTSILLALCLALATGKHFLGYFRVLRSIRVVVMTGESGLAIIKDTLTRICRAQKIDPTKVTNLVISDKIPRLSNPVYLKAIRQLFTKYKPDVLAVDPAYLALDGTDASNVMIFGQQLRAISELCQEMGVALLLCHHTKKGSGLDFQPLQLTDAAWAGFAEHCRQWLLVNHRESYDHATGTFRLWLSSGGSAGHGGLWAVDVRQGCISDPGGRVWDVTVQSADEAKSAIANRREQVQAAKNAKQMDADRQVVLAAAVKLNGPDTKNALRDRVSCGHRRFDVAFASLVADGTLQPAVVVKANGQKYDGWSVQNDE